MQSKVQKDEIKKRDNEIMELTNETLKNTNEFNKKIALIEQERDFLRNDMAHLKENYQRKEIEVGELAKQFKEKDEKIKSYKQKNKLSSKEA